MRLLAAAALLVGIVLALAPAGSSAPKAAAPLFSINFEGGLAGWVGKGGNAHHGVIVDDPLRPGNHALTFTLLESSGDIFSPEIPISRTKTYQLRFEYLGRPGQGVPKNLGGTIGISLGTPGPERWLAGTQLGGGIEKAPLVDDGHWKTYTIQFKADDHKWGTGTANIRPASIKSVRLVLEDWAGSHGVAGDVYFDNISLSECSSCETDKPFKVNIQFHAQNLVTAPPSDGGQCPNPRMRAQVMGHIEAQVTPLGHHEGGGTVADHPHRSRCRVPVIDFRVDSLSLRVLKPEKRIEVVMHVHISSEGVHQPGQCRVGTEGTVTARYDDTGRGTNSIRLDRLRIGPWKSPCNAHDHLITNTMSSITAHASSSTWVVVWIGCLDNGYSPRNCK